MTLMNLTAGKWVSQAIAVVAELGIADLLKDGPKMAADIARTANASRLRSSGERSRKSRMNLAIASLQSEAASRK